MKEHREAWQSEVQGNGAEEQRKDRRFRRALQREADSVASHVTSSAPALPGAAAHDDGGGRLVTAGLDAEDDGRLVRSRRSHRRNPRGLVSGLSERSVLAYSSLPMLWHHITIASSTFS